MAKAIIPTDAPRLYGTKLRRFLSAANVTRGAEGVWISSVVPRALLSFIRALRDTSSCRVIVLGSDLRVPIRNLYGKPSQVGQDRLVNAFAARELYGTPALVIDFGTAVTFDCVSRRGEYLGGLILPGTRISLEALYEKTALLPEIGLKDVRGLIGRTTEESMRAGILFGFAAACEGLIALFKKRFGRSLKLIATGGDSSMVARYTRCLHKVDTDLTLKGIQLISSR